MGGGTAKRWVIQPPTRSSKVNTDVRNLTGLATILNICKYCTIICCKSFAILTDVAQIVKS